MTLERPVGTIESNFLLIHDYFGGSYTGAEAVKVDGPLARDVAVRALEALVRRHPVLRARVEYPPGDTTPNLVAAAPDERTITATVSGPHVVLGEWTSDEWQIPLQEAIVGFWDRDRPLWRFRLLSNATRDRHLLVFAVHHVISDALSLTYLLKSFLAGCAKLSRGEEPDATPQEMLPAIEHLADAAQAVKRDWGQLAQIARAHLSPTEMPYAPDAPASPWRTGVESAVLDAQATAALLAAGRARRTPLTGLLTAALCQAVQEVYSTSGTFLVACPMSCRALSRKVRLDDQRIGCYARTAFVHSPAADLWTRAASISQRLEVLSKAATFQKTVRHHGALRVLRTVSRIRRRGFTDLAISNLGIVDFASQSFAPLTVDWLRMGANVNGGFEAFLLGTCIVQKKLSLNLAFPEPHVSRAVALDTFARLQAILAASSSSGA